MPPTASLRSTTPQRAVFGYHLLSGGVPLLA
jgi:hypothetical protein